MNGEEKNWTSSEKIITKFYCFHDVIMTWTHSNRAVVAFSRTPRTPQTHKKILLGKNSARVFFIFYRLPQNGVLSALCSDYYEIIESPKGIRSGHRYRLKTWTWAMAHEPNFVELQIVKFL